MFFSQMALAHHIPCNSFVKLEESWLRGKLRRLEHQAHGGLGKKDLKHFYFSKKEQRYMNEKGLQGAAAECYFGKGAGETALPWGCQKEGDALRSGCLMTLQTLTLPLTVELFPNGILPAGSAPLLSGTTSSV